MPSPPAPVFRVARGDAGPPSDPFAPPGWERAGADGTFGNRFIDPSKVDGRPDEARFRMIYAATQQDGAFAETIAHFRPDLEALAALRAIRGATGEPQPLVGAIRPLATTARHQPTAPRLRAAPRRCRASRHPRRDARHVRPARGRSRPPGYRCQYRDERRSAPHAAHCARCLRADGCDRCADLWWDPLFLAPWSDGGVLGALRGSARW